MEFPQLLANVNDNHKKKFLISRSEPHFALDIKVIGIIRWRISWDIGLVLNVRTLKEAFIASIDREIR